MRGAKESSVQDPKSAEKTRYFLYHQDLDLRDPSYSGKNFTNHVLYEGKWESKQTQSKQFENFVSEMKGSTSIYKPDKQNRIEFYIPGYIRMKVKNFVELEHADLSATLNVSIEFMINMKNVPEILQLETIKRMLLRFNADDAVSLKTEDSVHINCLRDHHKGTYTFIIRKLIHADMRAKHMQLILTPFQLIKLLIGIKVESVTLTKKEIDIIIQQERQWINSKISELRQYHPKQGQQSRNSEEQNEEWEQELHSVGKLIVELMKVSKFETIVMHFNLMDYPPAQKTCCIGYNSQSSFGSYGLAQKMLEVEFSNWADYDEEPEFRDYSVKNPFCYAHFVIPIYKRPFVGLITIFFPIWLLGILTLGIFLQEPELANRLNSLATLMIAFIAFIPTVREQLPPTPKIALVEYLVYFMTVIVLLCFVQSMEIRSQESNLIIPQKDGLFVVSVVIMILQVLIVLVLLVRFYYRKKKYYKHSDYNQREWSINHLEWENERCDKHFRNKYQSHQIKYFGDPIRTGQWAGFERAMLKE